MGGGTNTTAHEAKPWINRMGQHTGSRAGWTLVFSIPLGTRGSLGTLEDWLSTDLSEETLMDEMAASPY
jgi:hypothetical protein